MAVYEVAKRFLAAGVETENAGHVAAMFGLDARGTREVEVVSPTEIRIEAGQVVYITGASGSGKSVVLGQLWEQLAQKKAATNALSKEPPRRCAARTGEQERVEQEKEIAGKMPATRGNRGQDARDTGQARARGARHEGKWAKEAKKRIAQRDEASRPRGKVMRLEEIELPEDVPVVDCLRMDLDETFEWLSLAGLSEAYALLRRPGELSDGQRYRLRLALAMAAVAEGPTGEGVVFVDEFCATLDRVTAAVVAHNVRRAADRYGITFVVATSHDDLLEDLGPDVIVVKSLGGACEVFYPARADKMRA